MLEQIKAKLAEIKNPATGKTLGTENRWKNIQMNGDQLVAEYDREGISPQEKRVIQTEIQAALKDIISTDKIMIKTVSNQSKDVFKALDSEPSKTVEAQSKPAQIK